MSFLPKNFPAWFGCLLIFISSPLLHALDGPTSFIIDLPFQANAATPEWLGHPVAPTTAFATLDLPIIPPDSSASLLVTVYFQEKTGGFLRITWDGMNGAQLLSSNFYEGIGMANQRALLVSPEILLGPGTLHFQCGDTSLGIQRIKLEWLENQNGLVSPQIQNLLVTPATGITQPAQNLDGQLQQEEAAAWHNQLVNVPIASLPQRIEDGVEFNVQLDNAPSAARLVLQEDGLTWGKHLVVWINQQRIGAITPEVPDLMDEGYLSNATLPNTYIGWRNGAFYVPVSILKVGVNAVQFSVEDDVPSTNSTTTTVDPSAETPLPLAVKDVVLQLAYPVNQPTPASDADQSQASSTPAPTTSETNSP